MPFRPGQSGNPAGRAPKNRTLTDILAAAGAATDEVDGHKVARKRLIARLVWEVATTGRATFPDGTVLQAAPKDWLDTVKWIYTHIDGPARAEIGLSGQGGGPIAVKVEHDLDQAAFAAAFSEFLGLAAGGLADGQPDGAGEPLDSAESDR